MASEQEDFMPVETPSQFARVIQDHLELKRRNSALEPEMPLERYMHDDPFQNHPLFKTEEQARIEETLDGVESIADQATSLDWPTLESSFAEGQPQVGEFEETVEAVGAADPPSDENLWSRSRDFDWGD
jgi:hypothetical protein